MSKVILDLIGSVEAAGGFEALQSGSALSSQSEQKEILNTRQLLNIQVPYETSLNFTSLALSMGMSQPVGPVMNAATALEIWNNFLTKYNGNFKNIPRDSSIGQVVSIDEIQNMNNFLTDTARVLPSQTPTTDIEVKMPQPEELKGHDFLRDLYNNTLSDDQILSDLDQLQEDIQDELDEVKHSTLDDYDPDELEDIDIGLDEQQDAYNNFRNSLDRLASERQAGRMTSTDFQDRVRRLLGGRGYDGYIYDRNGRVRPPIGPIITGKIIDYLLDPKPGGPEPKPGGPTPEPEPPAPVPVPVPAGSTAVAPTQQPITDLTYEPVVLPSFLPTVPLSQPSDIDLVNNSVTPANENKIIQETFTDEQNEDYYNRSNLLYIEREYQDNLTMSANKHIIDHELELTINTRQAPIVKNKTNNNIFKIREGGLFNLNSLNDTEETNNNFCNIYSNKKVDLNKEISILKRDKKAIDKLIKQVAIGTSIIKSDNTKNNNTYIKGLKSNENLFNSEFDNQGFKPVRKPENYKLYRSYNNIYESLRQPEYRKSNAIY